jgi:hypothetical protein
MTTIPLLEVISFSTEHPVNLVNNLIKGLGKWTNPVKNVSAVKGQEITEIEAEFRLPLCKIEVGCPLFEYLFVYFFGENYSLFE